MKNAIQAIWQVIRKTGFGLGFVLGGLFIGAVALWTPQAHAHDFKLGDLVIDHPHPVLAGLQTGDHAYFVHSYHFKVTDPAQRLAHVDYGADVTAIIGRDTMVGAQFHPEKSQATGLRLIANFLSWKP